jgi:lipopolysaccharide heptosyltransferase II
MWLSRSRATAAVHQLAALRSPQPDLAISFSGQFACLFAFASGARHRVGYAEEGYASMLTLAVPGRRYHGWSRHEVHWNEELARAAGAPPLGKAPALAIPEGQLAWLRAALARWDIGEHGYVVLCPGASNGSAKRYLPERWASVADALVHETGMRVILAGSSSERPLADHVASLMLHEPVNIAGETSLDQLMAVLGGARLLLANDSAPSHLAGALGVPVVAVFGPTDPAVYRPFSTASAVVRSGIWCSPCYNLLATAECPLRFTQPPCMSGLPARRVTAAALELLGGRSLPRENGK